MSVPFFNLKEVPRAEHDFSVRQKEPAEIPRDVSDAVVHPRDVIQLPGVFSELGDKETELLVPLRLPKRVLCAVGFWCKGRGGRDHFL